MPMFDYQCKTCGDTSEYIVRSAAAGDLRNYPKVKFSD